MKSGNHGVTNSAWQLLPRNARCFVGAIVGRLWAVRQWKEEPTQGSKRTCLLLAQSGHGFLHQQVSAFGPKRTFALNDRISNFGDRVDFYRCPLVRLNRATKFFHKLNSRPAIGK